MNEGGTFLKKRLIALILAAAVTASLFLFSSCEEESYTKSFFALNTFCSVTVPMKNKKAADEVARKISEAEKVFSAVREDSELYKINQNGGGELSRELYSVLKKALEINALLPAFDPSLYNLTLLWGFGSEPSVPSEKDISDLLLHTGADKITLADGAVTLKDGARIDLGAVAKGYLSEVARDILAQNGVERGIVNLGGNVYVSGKKENGSDYKVGIKKPFCEDILGVLTGGDLFYVTSGSYERYFTENGENYCHILDPKTGYPAKSGLYSVTVVSKDGTLSDALSTAFFIMGAEASLEYIEKTGVCEAVFVTEQKEIILTNGLKENFTLLDNGYQIKD